MADLVFDVPGVNLELLHEQLSAALGPALHGLTAGPDGVRVHLDAVPDDTLRARVDGLVDDHDPAQRTARQERIALRSARKDALRSTGWANWASAERDEFLQLAAQDLGMLDLD